jgi:hypothetical protein
MAARSLSALQGEIDDWINESTETFLSAKRGFVDGGKIWVLKFISPRFLSSFLRTKLLMISATPGFTWGDGVYVTPISNPYSTMMYGRVGVMGWLKQEDVAKVYDASADPGIRLYQQWIQYSSFLFRQLTTTIHADLANRILRNSFRRSFAIDLVLFPPDQFNRAYVDSNRDRWFVISDWSYASPQPSGQRPQFSSRVRDCEWVALVQEEFEESNSKTQFRDLVGPFAAPPGLLRIPTNRPNLGSQLMATYSTNRAATSAGQSFISIRP